MSTRTNSVDRWFRKTEDPISLASLARSDAMSDRSDPEEKENDLSSSLDRSDHEDIRPSVARTDPAIAGAGTRGRLPRSSWLTPHPELRGVFVGGCVLRGIGSKFRGLAHAHVHGRHRGWICFRSSKWIHVRGMWLHELAHVVVREGHTDRWRALLVQIGGSLDPMLDPRTGEVVSRSYRKVSRGMVGT